MSLIFEALQRLERRRAGMNTAPSPEMEEMLRRIERKALPQWESAPEEPSAESNLNDAAESYRSPGPTLVSMAPAEPVLESPADLSAVVADPIVADLAASGPVISGPEISDPVNSDPVIAGPVLTIHFAPGPAPAEPALETAPAPSPEIPGPVLAGIAAPGPMLASANVSSPEIAPSVHADPAASIPDLAGPMASDPVPASPANLAPALVVPVQAISAPPTPIMHEARFEAPPEPRRAEAPAPTASPAPLSAPARPENGLTPLVERLAGIRNQQRALREMGIERGVSISRIADHLETVRNASERNTLQQKALLKDIRGIGKKLGFLAMTALGLMAASVVITLALYLHMLKIIP